MEKVPNFGRVRPEELKLRLTSVGLAGGDLLASHANTFHDPITLTNLDHTSALILGAWLLHTDLVALGKVSGITMEALF